MAKAGRRLRDPNSRTARHYAAALGFGIAPTSLLCDRLMNKYLSLDLHAKAEQALDALCDRKLAILSNGRPAVTFER
jgi:hypothetical protein